MAICEYQQGKPIYCAYRLHVFHSWRRMRRAAQEALTGTAVQRYHPIQTKQATILVSALLSNPKNRDQHFQRAAASTMTSILYDFSTQISKQDGALEEIDRTADSFVRAAAGTSLVEFFPWMMFIPQRYKIFPDNSTKAFTSNERTCLRSGKGKLWNNLLSVRRCFYDYSIVSKLTLYVSLSECASGERHNHIKSQ